MIPKFQAVCRGGQQLAGERQERREGAGMGQEPEEPNGQGRKERPSRPRDLGLELRRAVLAIWDSSTVVAGLQRQPPKTQDSSYSSTLSWPVTPFNAAEVMLYQIQK